MKSFTLYRYRNKMIMFVVYVYTIYEQNYNQIIIAHCKMCKIKTPNARYYKTLKNNK